jgi:CheY-like chemotaxis protein
MSKTILVVHPERHIRRLAQLNMERQGYRVTFAADASEAIAEIEKDPPDIVLVDERNQDIVDALADNPNTHNVRVLVVGKDVPSIPPDL